MRLTQAFRKRDTNAIQLGQHTIPLHKLFEHVMVSGNPGSGKSTFIRQIARQAQAQGWPAIIMDIEGESTMEFYDESRGDVILNPLDSRCPFWGPLLEFREQTMPMDRAAMAASLIRDLPHTSTERYFFESGRTVIESLLEVVTDEDPQAISALLALPRAEVHKALRGTRAYPLIDPDMKETGQTILSTAVNAVKPFQHLPRANQSSRRWSAREWVEHRKGWVFLPSRADSEAAVQGQQGVWLDSLVRWLLAAEIASAKVLVLCDELPAMGNQPNITSCLARGRKREIACVIGFQSISQLRVIYGHDGATVLTSCPTTQIFLRTPDPETSKWASDSIGSHEVERLAISQLTGLSNYREGLTLNPHRAVEPLVIPGEIQGLEPFEGYICCGGARTAISIPRMHLVKHNPDFIPRISATTPEAIAQAAAEGPTDAEIVAQVTARTTTPSAQPRE